jgi:murein DD-endopeptidase MepM/ murein hydrolase activator NlpD
LTRIDAAPDTSRRLPLLIGSAVATLCLGAGVASAQTPEPAASEAVTEPVPEETAPAPAENAEAQPAGAPAAAADDPAADGGDDTAKQRRAGLRLMKEEASPQKAYFAGLRKVRFEYKFAGSRNADLVVELIKRKSGADELIRRFSEKNVEAEKLQTLRWNGDRSNGKAVRKGSLYFAVREAGGKRLKRERASGDRDFRVFPAIFPVRGGHQYWDGWGAGRGHQGQDVGAKCGTPLVAAEPGKVAFKGYDGGGYGYYLIVNVRNANRAEVYAHLKRKATVGQGSKVKTGERIGKVGETGNASGCHLHFEYYKGDWPGGHPSPAATKRLKRWDKYS